ncbi:hypothetical protein Tco_1126840 [Tanacetum coccineum]
MVPRTVLTRFGLILLNIASLVNTVQPKTAVNNAGPMKNVINNAYSTTGRPFNKITAANSSNFTKKVYTVKGTRVNTARPKSVLSVGNPQQDLKDKGVIDSGCSRHMTGNKSYLTDYEEIDRGFVAFGDFKLTDESHVLLKVPRKDNMYSVDLKNVVPQGGLTCLFAKATPIVLIIIGIEADMTFISGKLYKMGYGPVFNHTDTQGQNQVLLQGLRRIWPEKEKEKQGCGKPSDIDLGGNDESKKMQKYILKQQFEGFSVSNSEGLHKGYDGKLIIVSTAYGVSNPSGQNSQYKQTSSYSLLANQSSCPQLDHGDLEQLDEFDLEKNGLEMAGGYDFNENEKVLQKDRIGGQLWYEEKIRFMKIDLDDKTDVLTYHKKLLAEAEKEKEDLKAKVGKWHNSSKNLGKLLNTQMSANDKFGLGYGDYRYDGILSYENEVLQSIAHNLQFTYGPKQSQPSESETQTSDFDTYKSDYSVETHESLPEPTLNEPKVVNQPKVWSDAPIIEEYELDSKDEHVSLPSEEHETPIDKKGLGYGFTARACFVCGSLSHLIRDCNFHEKRMAKQAELNNSMRKKSSQREIRPIWNNVQRVNHKNQFVLTAVLTRTGKIPVNTTRASGTNNVSTARHNFNRQTIPTSAAMKVNTVKSIVNRVRPANLVLLGEKGKLLLSPQKVVIGDQKDITGKISLNTIVNQDYPQRALQNKGIVDSGCSRHMTGNKAYLAEY